VIIAAFTPAVAAPGLSPRPGASGAPVSGALMIRIFFFVVLAGLVAIAGGVLMLGAFPPTPHQQPVEKVVPNDKFTAH
jgi:hypothetical protein